MLSKKWRSLPNDLADAELQITSLYTPINGDDKLLEYRAAFFNGRRATILKSLDDGTEVVKMRLDCESLQGNDKLRLVFVAVRRKNSVLFIELYAKNEKTREDQKRIAHYL
jgi:hypothetical protein